LPRSGAAFSFSPAWNLLALFIEMTSPSGTVLFGHARMPSYLSD
jgi:hypothetical protein